MEKEYWEAVSAVLFAFLVGLILVVISSQSSLSACEAEVEVFEEYSFCALEVDGGWVAEIEDIENRIERANDIRGFCQEFELVLNWSESTEPLPVPEPEPVYIWGDESLGIRRENMPRPVEDRLFVVESRLGQLDFEVSELGRRFDLWKVTLE